MKYKILIFLLVIFSIIKNINALSVEVNDKSSFYDSLSNGVDIILTKDIYLDKEYLNVEEQYFLVNSTNNITIDLNGYNIYGLSLFIVETNLNIINTSTNNSLITGLNDSEIVALMFGNLYINNVTLQYVNTNDNNYMQIIHVLDGNLNLTNSRLIGIRGIYLDYCDECNVILNNSCFDTSKQSLISHNGSLEVYGGSYRSENMFSMELYKSSISIYDGKFEGYYGGLFLDELTLISIESGEFFSKGDFGAITSLKEPNIFLLNNSVINDDSYNIYSCSLFDFEQNVLLDKIYSFNKFVEVKRYNEDFIDDDKLDDNYDYDNKEENNVDVENQEDCNIDKENLEDNTTFEIIENPKTGDNIFMLLITLFCSLILIIIIILIDICILF